MPHGHYFVSKNGIYHTKSTEECSWHRMRSRSPSHAGGIWSQYYHVTMAPQRCHVSDGHEVVAQLLIFEIRFAHSLLFFEVMMDRYADNTSASVSARHPSYPIVEGNTSILQLYNPFLTTSNFYIWAEIYESRHKIHRHHCCSANREDIPP